MIRLGPFELTEPIGAGGFAEVWAARHVTEGVPVAVKVLTAKASRQPLFVSAFQREVRAAAGLDHPSIVELYDHGTIPREVDLATRARLREGSPYLVMERLDGGSLHKRRGRLEWPKLRSILLAVLDALAHAHARGVIHRDIKPGNILLDAAGEPKLTDFGVAHAVLRDATLEDTAEEFLGTPSYMAPEQFFCRWRDYGPWTDLYALGCTTWALVWREPPFGRKLPLDELALRHIRQRPAVLEAPTPLPPGFRTWLGRLLAKEPADRFATAADASWALLALAPPPEFDEGPEVTAATLNWSQQSVSTVLHSGAAPPMPSNWDRRDPPGGHRHLLGAGLGLYGLRAIQLVGRQRERDALWDALASAREDGHVRAVVMRGPAGVGKSRLAEWLCERSQEVGAAAVLRAVHSARPGPLDGLGPMIGRHFRCDDLDREATRERLTALLKRDGVESEGEVAALTELVRPATDAERRGRPGLVRFRSPMERYVLVERAIRRAAGNRAAVVWVDDAQWGADGITMAMHLAGGPGKVLIVLTVRDEALMERRAERELLEQVLDHPQVSSVSVAPLPATDRRALVRELLGLEGRLAAEIERRSAGNPLFAVQMVGELVQRGLLEQGRRGFRLRDGARADLPEDLNLVWDRRIERFLEGRGEEYASTVELAALLGQDVLAGEWQEACAQAGLTPAPDLGGRLREERLARPLDDRSDRGWAFVHGMLREALERRARRSGRAPGLHEACAAMLDGRSGPLVGERLARHLVGAGRLEEALGPMLEGAIGRFRAEDLPEMETLLLERDRVIEELGLPESDGRRGPGMVWWSRLDARRARLADAEKWAKRAGAAAKKHGWRLVRGRAARELGRLARQQGRFDAALEHLFEAAAIAEELDDGPTLALVHRDLGDVHLDQGDFESARSWCRRALEGSRQTGDDIAVGTNLLEIATIEVAAGRLEDSEAFAEEARALFESTGFRWGVASSTNMLAEVARERGDLETCERLYRTAIEYLDAIGDEHRVFIEANLGLVALLRERYLEAGPILEGVLTRFEADGRQPMMGIVHAFLLPVRAAEGDWAGFREELALAKELLERTSYSDRDVVRTAEMAAELAAENGRTEEAAGARALAESQRRT